MSYHILEYNNYNTKSILLKENGIYKRMAIFDSDLNKWFMLEDEDRVTHKEDSVQRLAAWTGGTIKDISDDEVFALLL